MKSFVKILLVIFIAIACKQTPKISVPEVPKEYRFENQIGYVNDFDNVFTLEEENNLEKIFADYDAETTNEIGVVTVKSIEPFDDINQMNDAILTNWRFGKDNKYNGLIFLIDKNHHQLSIRFGEGIQKKLFNIETQRIIDEEIVPNFKGQNYYEGILAGFESIKQKLK